MRRAVGATLVLVLNRAPNAHPNHLEEWPPRDTHAAARAHMNTRVEHIREFVGTDCEDLCQATEEAIIDALTDRVMAQIEQAVETARAEPQPTIADLTTDVLV
mgnify:CR=1 FL=1